MSGQVSEIRFVDPETQEDVFKIVSFPLYRLQMFFPPEGGTGSTDSGLRLEPLVIPLPQRFRFPCVTIYCST